MKEKFCLYCGAALPQSAKFCSSCGREQEVVEQVSKTPVAETVEVVPEAEPVVTVPAVETAPVVERTPLAVAVAHPTSEPPAPPAAKTAPVPVPKKRKLGWLQSALLLLLASAMMAMAFLPVAKLVIAYFEDDFEGMKLGFSPLNLIVFAFDSFRNLDDEELADSSVYEKLEKTVEELEDIEDFDSYNDLSLSNQKKCEKFVRLLFRMTYQSEDSNYTAIFYVMAVFALLYLMLCTALFLLALLNLLSSLKLLPFGKRLNTATVSIFCAVPVLLLTFYYIVFATYDAVIPAAMSAPAIVTLILSGVGVAVLAIVAFFEVPKGERKVPVLRIVSACFAILLICMLYVPVMSAHVKTIFDGREKKSEVTLPMTIAFFDQLKGNTEDSDYYEIFEDVTNVEAKELLTNYFETFSYYTVRDIKQGVANSVNNEMVIASLAAGDVLLVCRFFAQANLLYLLIMIGAALLLWQNLCYFAGGKTANSCVLAGKIISVIAATLSLMAIIAFVLILHLCVDKYAPDGYRIFFTAGSVLTLVAVIAACACPVEKKKRKKIE